MSAAAARSRLAAAGCDIVALEGDPATRRGAVLLRRLAGQPDRALSFEALATVPPWLRLPHAAQRRIAQRAGLASLSAALAASIDGSWLGGHAALAGDDAVEWALDADPAAALSRALPSVPAAGLEPRGFALLRATLPAALRPLLAWCVAEPADPPADRARACVAAALAAA